MRKQMGAGGRECSQICHPNLVSNARTALGISEVGDPKGVPQLPLSGCECSCSPIAAAPPPSAFVWKNIRWGGGSTPPHVGISPSVITATQQVPGQ